MWNQCVLEFYFFLSISVFWGWENIATLQLAGEKNCSFIHPSKYCALPELLCVCLLLNKVNNNSNNLHEYSISILLHLRKNPLTLKKEKSSSIFIANLHIHMIMYAHIYVLWNKFIVIAAIYLATQHINILQPEFNSSFISVIDVFGGNNISGNK